MLVSLYGPDPACLPANLLRTLVLPPSFLHGKQTVAQIRVRKKLETGRASLLQTQIRILCPGYLQIRCARSNECRNLVGKQEGNAVDRALARPQQAHDAFIILLKVSTTPHNGNEQYGNGHRQDDPGDHAWSSTGHVVWAERLLCLRSIRLKD